MSEPKRDDRIFNHEEWNSLVEKSFAQIKELAFLKGGEYSGDFDRLANFRRNAENLGLDYRQVWAIYSAKHWDALMQFVKDIGQGKDRLRLEGIDGRIDDLLVYLLLFKAMWVENGRVFVSEGKNLPPKGGLGVVKKLMENPQ